VLHRTAVVVLRERADERVPAGLPLLGEVELRPRASSSVAMIRSSVSGRIVNRSLRKPLNADPVVFNR
jgi:hypothetical protein